MNSRLLTPVTRRLMRRIDAVGNITGRASVRVRVPWNQLRLRWLERRSSPSCYHFTPASRS
jgi:hypothetical protein